MFELLPAFPHYDPQLRDEKNGSSRIQRKQK